MAERARCSWLILALLTASCSGSSPERAPVGEAGALRVPAKDASAICSDMGELRVCWGGSGSGCSNGICVAARPLPDLAPPTPLGFRCTGVGAERVCTDRSRDVAAFDCHGAGCTQRHPRLPDASDWECADMAGVTLCLGGRAPAGVPQRATDAGFFCGERKTALKSLPIGHRVCVDFDPDYPDGLRAGWSCRWEHEPVMRRICDKLAGQARLGDSCASARPCVDGTTCVTGRCVPQVPQPSCWLDGDCPGGACRFGSCQSAR